MTIAGSLWEAIQGEAWDDLRTPASAIPIRGKQGDPDTDTDGTLLFDSASVEQISVLYQLPHSWNSTDVRPHLHWSKTTDAAGDVVWQFRYRVFNNGAVAPDWSAWTDASTRSQTIGADQKILIDGFGSVPMAGLRASCMLSIQFRRNTDDAGDTYGADARLWDADVHYRRYGLGSEREYPGA